MAQVDDDDATYFTSFCKARRPPALLNFTGNFIRRTHDNSTQALDEALRLELLPYLICQLALLLRSAVSVMYFYFLRWKTAAFALEVQGLSCLRLRLRRSL